MDYSELHYCHNWYSAYKRCELGCNGPIIRGTLHAKQSNFSALLRPPFEGFSWNPTSFTPVILPTNDVSLSSAINERQILYFAHIHERRTVPRSYSFLFISLRYSRVVLCISTPVHFPCMFSAFKSACEYFISHTFISEHWLWYTFSTHLTIYCFLEVHMSGSHDTMFCRLLFCIFILNLSRASCCTLKLLLLCGTESSRMLLP